MALPSHELNHRREVDHNDTEAVRCSGGGIPGLAVAAFGQPTWPIGKGVEDLLDRDRPRSHKQRCEDDRLSDLPDSMLHHIMSFLSAKEAARTCVLSQRCACFGPQHHALISP
ncbi:hypothetical protein C2845_PM13G09160 [Panicum miliaceum]|uniref:F-box domain-containing protein n=1 Tax=Panicum miliaceum TaxID=4540 RepID=A0A3L6RI17_PANMI|nr:hypothetical protein C2845_PM13G09160 [Panicum miliaceum]